MLNREQLIQHMASCYEADTDKDTELFREGFIEGAKWDFKHFLEKACNWLEEHAGHYTWYNEFEGESGIINDTFIDDFKKAMEE